VFVRLVGEYDSFYRDALRDEGRTGRPILVNAAHNGLHLHDVRGDFLFSFLPTRHVVFLGYGAGYADTRVASQPFRVSVESPLQRYNRTDDAFFVKAS